MVDANTGLFGGGSFSFIIFLILILLVFGGIGFGY